MIKRNYNKRCLYLGMFYGILLCCSGCGSTFRVPGWNDGTSAGACGGKISEEKKGSKVKHDSFMARPRVTPCRSNQNFSMINSEAKKNKKAIKESWPVHHRQQQFYTNLKSVDSISKGTLAGAPAVNNFWRDRYGMAGR